MRSITCKDLNEFQKYLEQEEKSGLTIEKYLRDLRAFLMFLDGRSFEKSDVLEYKKALCVKYAVGSVNSILSSLNCFFKFFNWNEMLVKTIKIQREMFFSEEKELTKAEYERLLFVAGENTRLFFLMQTICSTGIRVSELQFVTVEALKKGRAEILGKGKIRTVFLPNKLCVALKKYAKNKKIKSGSVFVTKSGNPLDRSNIWSEMKRLCKDAGISEKKVYPHNLRHLFARTYYTKQRDIVRLADILGHANINTTRIYTMESGAIHCKQIQNLGLFRCLPHNSYYVVE